jgi:hypothetical protein
MLWPRIALNFSPAFATLLLYTTFQSKQRVHVREDADECL